MSRYLALDWDQNQLHLVAAEVVKGSVKLKRVAVWQDRKIPNAAMAEEMGRILKDRMREAGIMPAPVLACVGRDRLVVKEIRFPQVPEAEEPAVVRFQTVKELTDAPEEVVLDYMKTGGSGSGEQKANVLIIRKDLLDGYKSICEAAGLKLAALTPRVLGVAATLRKVMGLTVVTPAPEPADGVIAVVSLGEKLAEISILRGASPLLIRSLQRGQGLAGEIRRNLVVHDGQMPHHPVRAVYLCGVESGELAEKLKDLIEPPVYHFDPFAWSGPIEVFGEDAEPGATSGGADAGERADSKRIPSSRRGTFAGPLGLLLLKSQSEELPINFASPRQPKPQANPNMRWLRLGAGAAVLLLLSLFGLGRVLTASWQRQLDQVEADRQEVEKTLNEKRAYAKTLKSIDDWDTVVWLDELYELTRKIPDVNTLRITSITGEPMARTGKSKVAARATIKGKLVGGSGNREPVDKLVEAFGKEGYYTLDAPKVENDAFTLVVSIERRAPGEYKELIPSRDAKKPSSSSDSADAQDSAGEDKASGESSADPDKGSAPTKEKSAPDTSESKGSSRPQKGSTGKSFFPKKGTKNAK